MKDRKSHMKSMKLPTDWIVAEEAKPLTLDPQIPYLPVTQRSTNMAQTYIYIYICIYPKGPVPNNHEAIGHLRLQYWGTWTLRDMRLSGT